jgi:hypothetical protein
VADATGRARAGGSVRAAGVWCAWVAASTLGLVVAGLLFFRLVGILEDVPSLVPYGWSDSLETAGIGGAAGAVLGLFQAAVLWPRLGGRGVLAWVAATAAGAALGLGVARGGADLFRVLGASALFQAIDAETWRLVALALLGASVGCGQWLVLRRGLARAAWWIPTCALATPTTVFALTAMSPGVAGPWWLFLAFFGAVTGAVLVLLPRREPTEAAP